MNDVEKIIIEISLGSLPFGHGEEPTTFADYIAGQAVLTLLHNEARGDYIGKLRSRVEQIRDEEIREAVRPLVAAEIAKGVQPTDSFGTARGEPRPLRDLILEIVKESLKATSANRSGFDKRRSLLEEVVRSEVETALRKELQQAVGSAREQVLATVQEEAAKVITETIARVARA